ncbi:MAG TPA: heavy-metal-associated domain-containing protein [Stenotrophomonas sp.]|jgi:copper chaperone|uniref:heavy-metal-associated domain-containing protein n=1 Tax=Stenotrophomonas pigmentata TaxID=3055080 RepID=UPI0026F1FEBA|nr:heavy-metal-associated domain-containing protein [Stenotrophomonas sp. 610A2]
MKLHIESMSCGGCARSVTAALKAVDPTATVEIDLPGRNVKIESSQPLDSFTKALEDVGFPAK